MHYTFTTTKTDRLGPMGGISEIFGIFQFQISFDLLPKFLHSFKKHVRNTIQTTTVASLRNLPFPSHCSLKFR